MPLQPHHSLLSEDQAQVWLADLRNWLPERDAFLSLLSEDEIQRVERYKIKDKQDQFIVSRGLLRQLLSVYLQVGPAEIQLITSEAGKPALPDHSLQFNLSHSGNWLLYGFTQTAWIGVDIQELYPITSIDTLIRNYFSEAERIYLETLSQQDRMEEFFNIWTAKEAYLKARGEGFNASPTSINLLLAKSRAYTYTVGGIPAAEDPLSWTIKSLDLPQGYRGAIAVYGPVREILLNPLLPGV